MPLLKDTETFLNIPLNRRTACKGMLVAVGSLLLDPVRCFAIRNTLLHRFREVRYVMGTLMDITVYHEQQEVVRAFFDDAFSRIEELDRLLSNFKPESETSRLNTHGELHASEDTRTVIKLGKKYAAQTNGLFDITVRPLVDLWQRAAEKNTLPSRRAIEKTKALVNASSLTFTANSKAALSIPGSAIETGGIGKGYAVDKIVELFPKYNIQCALINFGHSSIYARGTPPEADAWKILLTFPDEEQPRGVIAVRDTALSASASFGQSYTIQGKHFGHIIDPKSGMPLQEKRNVAVRATSAVEAEMLSTHGVLTGDTTWEKNILYS